MHSIIDLMLRLTELLLIFQARVKSSMFLSMIFFLFNQITIGLMQELDQPISK